MTNTETVSTERLERFMEWTRQHPAEWDLRTMKVNGRVSHFMDPDTDTAWLGFNAACDLLEASRTREPAEWQVEDEWLADWRKGLRNCWDEDESPSWPVVETYITALFGRLRAASIPAPERSKEETLRVKAEDGPMLQQVMGRFQIYQEMAPEEDETWESWYYAAIDMLRSEVREILSSLETPPLHKEGEAVYFADGNTVRKRVGSAFGEGDVLFCTPSAWFAANEVADLLNAAPVPVPVTITPDDGARDALLAEVISLIEDDMYGPGEAEDVPERLAFNRACRRQINRITSRFVVAPKLTASLSQKPGEQG